MGDVATWTKLDYDLGMDINIAMAKPRFSELIERAERGEIVRIARRGKPVVELRQITPPDARPFDWDALRERLRSDLADQSGDDPGDGIGFVEKWRREQPY